MSRAREIADRDLAATELILDADNDTSITADTDDQIDIKVAGSDHVKIKGGTNVVHVIEGSSGQGTPHTNSALVLESDGQTGINILSGNTDFAGLVFGDDGDNDIGFIQYKHDDNYLRFGTNTSEQMRIESGGDVKIASGDIYFGTSGKGINLGVTSNTDSNTLDDYEEGVFTLSFNGFVNQTVSQGYYVKVGRLCYVTTFFHANGSQNTNSFTCDLPFTAASHSASNNSGYYVGSIGPVMHYRVDTGSAGMVTYVAAGTAQFRLYEVNADGDWVFMQNNAFSSEDQAWISFTYVTAS